MRFGEAIGILLGSLSLIWHVVKEIRLDRARLRVTVQGVVVAGDGSPIHAVSVEAINVGRRPTLLTSLWLGLGRPMPWFGRWLPEKVRARFYTAQLLIPPLPYSSAWPLALYSSRLPTQLDVGAKATLFYPQEMVKSNLTKSGLTNVYGMASASTAQGRSRPIAV
jgi:hypothetical protein